MKSILAQLVSGKPLSEAQATEAFELLMTGQASPPQIAALLSLIEQRGATIDELTGAARVMRAKVAPVPVPAGLTVIDTCGTGGTHSRCFNISTTAGIIAAAAGRPRNVAVAKHGNRAVTSASGSSQALEALGLKLIVAPATLTRCLDEAGFCFCFAPAHHPAMKYAGPIRAELGFRTIFNLLGPLTNPAGARRQVLGVSSVELTAKIGMVLQRLGAEDAMVVHSELPGRHASGSPGKTSGGMGELMTTGPTHVAHLRSGNVAFEELDPRDLGLPTVKIEQLEVRDPADSARVIRSVLSGEKGPARDVACLNAAAALRVADLSTDWPDALDQARAAIDTGAARRVLETVVNITQADPTPLAA